MDAMYAKMNGENVNEQAGGSQSSTSSARQ